MVNRMVLNNLGHRPIRTALSVIAVAVEVLLIISVVGLVTGLLNEAAERQKGIGADIIVQPPSASAMMAMSSAPMPIAIADLLRKADGVKAVTPVMLQTFGGLTVAYGIDLESFNAVTRGFELLQGRFLQPNTFEMVIDEIYARDNNIGIGAMRKLWGEHEFEVVGIVKPGKGARLFVPIQTMQDLLGSQGKATVFYVKVTEPQREQEVLARIKSTLAGYKIQTMEEMTSVIVSGNLPGLKPFQRIMIGIAVVIGFLVIFLAMYTTVLERTREIGILKSLGASKSYIVNLILRETLIVAAIGILIGIGASIALRSAVLGAFPTLSILITPGWLARAAIIAAAGALLGAAYPALRAARQDPIEALAYE